MKRILSAAAAAAMGLGLLTACGGSDGGGKAAGGSRDYCTDLKAAKKQLDALKNSDLSGIHQTADALSDLADEASDSIKADWSIVVDGVRRLVAAIEKAGLDDDDIASLQSGQIPDGVEMSSLNDLIATEQALNTDKFKKAGDEITEHAKDKCGLDLSA